MTPRFTTPTLAALLTVFAGALTACTSTPSARAAHDDTPDWVVAADDVEWGALNPARGDASPRAGTLWGDRTGAGASGFLVRFEQGFSSPAHIHNITYRGVVIRGLVHNNDPSAEPMWLPAGSFWTQPAGAVHITAARDTRNLAYIEIDSGPYLVRPTDEAFHADESPINIDRSNLVWLDASTLEWIDAPGGAEIAYLWGDPQNTEPGGSLLRLPAGFAGTPTSASTTRAVVIDGTVNLSDGSRLEAGSAFGGRIHLVSAIETGTDDGVLLYLRTEGPYHVHRD